MLNPKENEGALARKSILFVDDDVSVLDSFRTSLRAYRDEWDMHFVAGGEEAMRVLAHDSFDVVICDMHMPVVDGATVLSHLKARHPKSLRILLSGQAEHEAALRLVPLAHQFLAKPCDPARTREVILRAAALQSRLHSSELRVSVSQVSQLPSPPETYTKLLNCMSSGGGSIRKIVAIVEEDPAICAKILQVANSPFFGARQPVADIQRAVMVMGTNFVRDLVLAFQSISSARKLLAPGLISLEDEQSRGLQVGQAARVIAKELVPDLANEAMVAGLLHDIGRVILAVLRPQQWRAYSDASVTALSAA